MNTLVRISLALSLAAVPLLADDYPRQPGVDAQHYQFRVTVTDDNEEISGETTAFLRFLEAGITRVSLDLASAKAGKGMTVTDVTSDGQPVPYTHVADRLTLTLSPAPGVGERRRFTIRYHGVAAGGLHFGKNRFGERTIFSWNWPTFARQWLPLIDHPYDKATSEFLVTAPAHYQVVANGALQEIRDVGNGRRLTHWKEGVPIASWLNNIGVAEFASRYFDTVRGVPLQTWIFPRDRDNGMITFEEPMRQAIEFFSEYIGPYPYEKLAGVQVNGMGGGMEHASAIFYGEKEVTDRPAFSLVAHEVSHQWWGDSVTEKDWNDAWLSEGFATYFAAMAQEQYQGRDAFLATMERSRAIVLQSEKKAAIPVIHDNLPEIRNGRAPIALVYQKGGWFLHMLRSTLGSDKFRQGIREYYRRFRDSNASTEDLQAAMQETSGEDLQWFFAQWLRRGESPTIRGSWSYDPDAKRVIVELAQTQPGEVYRLPLHIGINLPGVPPRLVRVVSDARSGKFELACEKEPQTVTLDPGIEVLMNAQFARK
ncbi:MAG TPA: M1 family metallopeptidase [Candidatus Acidoferrum sp.]|nr:M1 family metallopeptidase [Candidatus Acidoferrum sp.]